MNKKEVSFSKAFFPVACLLGLIIFGLFIGPMFMGLKAFPLEFIFLLASVIAVSHLKRMGYNWTDIFDSVIKKIAKAMPTLLILLAIGLIIGSWIACGTIPMLVYYGIKMISPNFIYVIAFIVPVIFSTVTGTSWGSVGTVGVVLMGVAVSYDANLAITAAAVIGGSFFGDKLSPLSDTTNVAALATEIEVYDHIRSMLYTTVPAALIAIGFYLVIGFIYPVETAIEESIIIKETLADTKRAFDFNVFLLLPPIIVLYGSLKKIPTLQVLVISSLVAVILALIFQIHSLDIVLNSLLTGFSTDYLDFSVTDNVANLFSRGGMYSMKEPLVVSLLVFVFVGTIDKINAMPIIVNKLFGWVKSRGGLVRSTLISAGVTNAMTSNQYATSFIVGDAFKSKFDEADIDRRVLSRSLEDTGTMLESLVPWHQTCVYMMATTGIAVADYWYWQVFSLSNILIAFIFTFIGFAIFKKNDSRKKT
jgi:NhaC family Na+:H+ antiporter